MVQMQPISLVPRQITTTTSAMNMFPRKTEISVHPLTSQLRCDLYAPLHPSNPPLLAIASWSHLQIAFETGCRTIDLHNKPPQQSQSQWLWEKEFTHEWPQFNNKNEILHLFLSIPFVVITWKRHRNHASPVNTWTCYMATSKKPSERFGLVHVSIRASHYDHAISINDRSTPMRLGRDDLVGPDRNIHENHMAGVREKTAISFLTINTWRNWNQKNFHVKMWIFTPFCSGIILVFLGSTLPNLLLHNFCEFSPQSPTQKGPVNGVEDW